MSKPIRPDQVAKLAQIVFPSEVFDAFNELIAKNYVCGTARVDQKDVVDLIMEKLGLENTVLNRQKAFDNKWLNIEEAYRETGWRVAYDKPGFNESYDAFFIFKQQ